MAEDSTQQNILVEQRRQEILNLFKQSNTVSTDSLVKRFQVSQMTIWRDLKALEERGIIRRIHGGATLLNVTEEPIVTRKQTVNRQAKERIASYAARHFVADNHIIIMEAGTTVMAMSRYLTHQNLTIITNGLGTLNALSSHVSNSHVMCCGGMLRDVSLTFVGPQAEQFFTSVRAHTLFLSGTGLTISHGLCDPNPLEIQIKQAMARSAQRIILLLDSSKFGAHSLQRILPISQIDALITEAPPSEEYVNWLNRERVKLFIAD
jgi:DeoR/GlpR family transcriptional regulator of sugar metabolism